MTTIRRAIASDVPSMLKLVQELATYEKAPNEVAVSVEEMTENGFGENALYEAFVAENENSEVQGMALFYYKYSTWKGRCLFLEDIVVNENLRGQGIGKLLFNAVHEVAKSQNVRRFEWQVLDWNTTAIEFYKKYKTEFDAEWINCKITEF